MEPQEAVATSTVSLASVEDHGGRAPSLFLVAPAAGEQVAMRRRPRALERKRNATSMPMLPSADDFLGFDTTTMEESAVLQQQLLGRRGTTAGLPATTHTSTSRDPSACSSCSSLVSSADSDYYDYDSSGSSCGAHPGGSLPRKRKRARSRRRSGSQRRHHLAPGRRTPSHERRASDTPVSPLSPHSPLLPSAAHGLRVGAPFAQDSHARPAHHPLTLRSLPTLPEAAGDVDPAPAVSRTRRPLRRSSSTLGSLPSADTLFEASLDAMTLDAGPPPPPEPPASVNPREAESRLRFLKRLGVGAFARVYLVSDRLTGRPRALKVMEKSTIVAQGQQTHVRNELDILRRLHALPHVISLHQHWQTSKYLYLLTEFVPGGEIFSRLQTAGPFDQATARFYAAEITVALAGIHANGVIYRDLKPENALLDAKGHVKLVDFGFARVLPPDTQAFSICGTPDYCAPEMILESGHGPAVDWWALGVMVYEMLCGHTPFSGDSPAEVYRAVLEAPIRLPEHLEGTQAGEFIMALLDRHVATRLTDATEVMSHPWFSGIDFHTLHTAQAPYVPRLASRTDTTHFYAVPVPGETTVPGWGEHDDGEVAPMAVEGAPNAPGGSGSHPDDLFPGW